MNTATRLLLGTAAVALTLPSAGQAQDAVQLEQYRPAPSVDDGFVISRPDDRGHLLFGARLDLSYALNPLVAERVRGDASTETASLVEHHFVGHLNLSFGLFERLVIYAGLPVTLVQDGESAGGIRGGDGAGLGDVFLGVRGRFYGEPGDVFAIGLQATVTFPTAGAANSGQPYSGESGVTLHPALLLELRLAEILRLTGNLGARFRFVEPARVANLSVSHELTWGIGATLEVVEDLLDLYLEGWGAATLANIGNDTARESTHFEMLGGARFEVIQGLEVGAAVGGGLARGYGSPDFRGILTVGYAQRPIRESTVGDRDGDGIMDDVDECPDEPEDIDRFEDDDGCPDPDNDQDGILDGADGCPNEPEDIDEFEDEDGCPDPDNDQDGILDGPDECPDEPEDVDTFEDENGCPDPDNDQDGVLDVDDRCPLVAGSAENQGCPLEAQIEEGQIQILRRVEFETDSDVLLDQSVSILDAVAEVLSDNPQLILIRIEGHTDDRASDEHNRDLSARRARTVARWLASHNINPNRLRAFGCGEDHPIESNATETGRQANRRVEFHILVPEPEGGRRQLPGCRELSL